MSNLIQPVVSSEVAGHAGNVPGVGGRNGFAEPPDYLTPELIWLGGSKRSPGSPVSYENFADLAGCSVRDNSIHNLRNKEREVHQGGELKQRSMGIMLIWEMMMG